MSRNGIYATAEAGAYCHRSPMYKRGVRQIAAWHRECAKRREAERVKGNRNGGTK